MGEYASASLDVLIGVGTGAVTGIGAGGGVNVGYLTEISCRKASRSSGDALIGIADAACVR